MQVAYLSAKKPTNTCHPKFPFADRIELRHQRSMRNLVVELDAAFNLVIVFVSFAMIRRE